MYTFTYNYTHRQTNSLKQVAHESTRRFSHRIRSWLDVFCLPGFSNGDNLMDIELNKRLTMQDIDTINKSGIETEITCDDFRLSVIANCKDESEVNTIKKIQEAYWYG